MCGFSLWNDYVVIRFASKRFGLVEFCIRWFFYCSKSWCLSMVFEWIWVLSLCVLVEGLTLVILVCRFLTIMRVTLSSHIRVAMWLLCMFFRLTFGHYVFSRVMVMGLFTWSWAYFHGLGINVSQKPVLGWPLCQDICFMVVGWYKLCRRSAFPLALSSNEMGRDYTFVCYGYLLISSGNSFSSTSFSYPTHRWTIVPLHRPRVIRNPMVLPCFYRRVSTYWLICLEDLQSLSAIDNRASSLLMKLLTICTILP